MSLLVTVKDNSNMFSTKNSIELKDCRGKTIVKTREGVSKLKDYKRAYYEAIKEAFKDVKKLNYHFSPSNSVVELKPIKKINTVKTVIKTDLFAQPIKNGFQLIDKKPSIIFTLLKTKKANTFIIKDKNGVMYKKEGVWIAEYYQKDKLIIETYQVKF